MKQFAALFLLPLGLAAAGAAGPPIVGTWDATATDARGVQSHWTILVRQDGEKLAATLQSDDGHDIPLQEPKFDAGEFFFQLRINPTELVKVALKLDGDRLNGRFEGASSGAGTLKATRLRPPDISGTWTGEWEVSPDGGPGPHYMVIKQDGEAVTGRGGPGEHQLFDLANGRFVNGHFTFDIALAPTAAMSFDFTVTGSTMSGVAVLKMNGTEKRLKLTAKRGPASK